MIKPSKFAGIVNSGITKSRNNQFDNVRFFFDVFGSNGSRFGAI